MILLKGIMFAMPNISFIYIFMQKRKLFKRGRRLIIGLLFHMMAFPYYYSVRMFIVFGRMNMLWSVRRHALLSALVLLGSAATTQWAWSSHETQKLPPQLKKLERTPVACTCVTGWCSPTTRSSSRNRSWRSWDDWLRRERCITAWCRIQQVSSTI